MGGDRRKKSYEKPRLKPVMNRQASLYSHSNRKPSRVLSLKSCAAVCDQVLKNKTETDQMWAA